MSTPTDSVTQGAAEMVSGQPRDAASPIESSVTATTNSIAAVWDDHVKAATTSTSSHVHTATSPTGMKSTAESSSSPTVVPTRTASRSGHTSGGTIRYRR